MIVAVALCPIVIEHEQPYGRRQVAVLAVGVDSGDEIRQGDVPSARDILEALPERVLKADAGLVAGDDDGAFDDRRVPCPSPVSIRCWSSVRCALSP
jgi:hypothetical protein